MKNKYSIELARISPNSNKVDVVELSFNPEKMKSVFEELVGGLAGVMKLDNGFFIIYNNSEFTEKDLDFNIGASWFIAKTTKHKDIKIYGNVLVASYKEEDPDTLRSIDFDKLSTIFKDQDEPVVGVSYQYRSAYATNPSIN